MYKAASLPFFLLFASAPMYGDTDLNARVQRLETDMKKVRGETAYGNYGAKTPSAAPQIDGYGFSLTADFLWWKLYEGGTDYLFKQEKRAATPPVQGPIQHMNFDWEPGFKVGAGYRFEHDGWDVFSQFTWFQTDAHDSTHTSFPALHPLVGQQTPTASKASAHWDVDFMDLELVLGRNYFVSRYLSLHPFFGLATTWIDQHRRFRFFTNTSDLYKIKSKNDFWGIGPRLGTDAQFFFTDHFSVYGAISGSLYYADFDVWEKEKITTLNEEIYNLHDDLTRLVPQVAFGLGLAYELNFSGDRYHVLMKAGYESQYWWRQNQLPIFDALSLNFHRQSEDLSLQGLTVHLSFDF